MAIVTLKGGDGQTIIKQITQLNFETLATAIDNFSDSDLLNVGGRSLSSFKEVFNRNVDTISEEVGTAPVASQGTLTVDAQVTADNTMTIGTTVYTFKATAAAEGDIEIGALLADTQANIVDAINGTDTLNDPHPLVSAGAFAADACVITARTVGVAGDLIATTETFTAETNIFDDDTLGTTTAGVDADYPSLTYLDGGDSWRGCRTKINTTLGALDTFIAALP